MEQIVRQRRADTDLFLHLGDGAFAFERIAERYPDRAFLCVRGNCDSRFQWTEERCPPEEQWITLEGKRLFFTHGHLYGVKGGLERLLATARAQHADLVLYGHTHQAFVQYLPATESAPEMYLLCPGSLSQPADGIATYGCIHIGDDGVEVHTAVWR